MKKITLTRQTVFKFFQTPRNIRFTYPALIKRVPRGGTGCQPGVRGRIPLRRRQRRRGRGKGGTVPVVNRVTIYPGHNAGLLESGIICRGTNARGNSFHERLRRIDFRVSRTFFPRHRSHRASHSSRSRRVSSHFFLSFFFLFFFPLFDGWSPRKKEKGIRR